MRLTVTHDDAARKGRLIVEQPHLERFRSAVGIAALDKAVLERLSDRFE